MKYHSALTSLLLSTAATTALAGKNGKANKKNKNKGSKSSKGGGEFDACVFANPAIAQTRDHHEEGDQDPNTVNSFINHALAVNEVFLQAVSGWVAGTSMFLFCFENITLLLIALVNWNKNLTSLCKFMIPFEFSKQK